jgi:hypothetical protein
LTKLAKIADFRPRSFRSRSFLFVLFRQVGGFLSRLICPNAAISPFKRQDAEKLAKLLFSRRPKFVINLSRAPVERAFKTFAFAAFKPNRR